MIKKLLVFKSNSFNPYENLATEKYLLDTVPADCFVLYLWQNENTIVIGRNQNPWTECKCKELEADGGYLARRLSGGGAVFHDRGNLNFTFISTSENYSLDRNLEIIRKACKYSGVDTEISGRNDILAEGRKFSGNAFYNSKGKTYHHGTVLVNADFEKMSKYLTPSKAKLEAKGVKSVKSRTVNLSELSPLASIENLTEFFIKSAEEVLNLKSQPIHITDFDTINKLTSKFSHNDWKYGETLPFSAIFSNRFDWGSLELRLNIEKGSVSSCQIFTDSMDEMLADKICQALCGCEFEPEKLKANLIEQIPDSITNDIISILKNNEI